MQPPPSGLCILDASIADLLAALAFGQTTSVELVARYLRRASVYDANGLQLSSIPILNPTVFDEAAASDARRTARLPPRQLEGIPFLVKDNIKVKGMTVAAGSHAFENLVATEDAASVSVLRAAGAVVIGRTNMPGMANGGMQRGLYGRAESPYNLEYLTAAFASGSSNGSATATAANFAAFALGTETVSSGRSPASNNSLVAYTPSRGLLPLRGVWPLYPTCDVLVPYTRTMADLFHVLDVLTISDPSPAGDFWAAQPFISLPKADSTRPATFHQLKQANALKGKRLGVPSMYIGGSSPVPVRTRRSVISAWERAKSALIAAGATVIELDDFPLVTTYESTNAEDDGVWANIAGLPKDWLMTERCELISHAWDDFLTANKQAGLDTLAVVDPKLIFPLEPDTLKGETEEDSLLDWQKVIGYSKAKLGTMFDLPGTEQGLKALEEARKVTLQDWMDTAGLDAVIFPANGDVGPANADKDLDGCNIAWQNGVLYSNGNLPIRHLGVPTISVPMGMMEDTAMPVNLTIAGRAYDDNRLLELGYAFEAATGARVLPSLTPALDSDYIASRATKPAVQHLQPLHILVTEQNKSVSGTQTNIDVRGVFEYGNGDEIESVICYMDGEPQQVSVDGKSWRVAASREVKQPWSHWRSPALAQVVIVLTCRLRSGLVAGRLVTL